MSGEYRLDRHIFLEYALPAKEDTVRLYGKGFGGTEKRLEEGKTVEERHFKAYHELAWKPTSDNIKAGIVNVHGNEILSISECRFALEAENVPLVGDSSYE